MLDYAADNSHGPGAIFVGDLALLAGPAPNRDLGNREGLVPLEALQENSWVFYSDYYYSLLEAAKLTDPTPLTSRGERIEIRFSCIHWTLSTCQLLRDYFAPNVRQRTGGQVTFDILSYPELGVAGPDALELIGDGWLDAGTVVPVHLSLSMPEADIQNLWGIYSSGARSLRGNVATLDDLEPLIRQRTGGGVIMNRGWSLGDALYVFCKSGASSPGDLSGRKIRSFSAPLSDWLRGMGANPRLVPFSHVYSLIERGELDCGAAGALAAIGQRWFEVTDHVTGPLHTVTLFPNVVNAQVWAGIPTDLQQIILEEGAKSELEAFRVGAYHATAGIAESIRSRLQYVPFTDEMKQRSRQAAVDHVIPAWVERVGDTGDPIISDTFNRKLGPIVGMRINPDGTVTDLGEPFPPPLPTDEASSTVTSTETRTPSPLVETDREVLEAFYHATGGPDWVNDDNWLSERPIGEWHGVTTDAEGRVVELNFSINGLRGELPPELGGLQSLEKLSFRGNPLSGVIPPELGLLPNLRVLMLAATVFEPDTSGFEWGNTWGAGAAVKPRRTAPLEQPAVRLNSPAAGQPAESGDPAPLWQSAVRRNTRRAGRTVQPASPGPLRKQVDRRDSAPVGQSGQSLLSWTTCKPTGRGHSASAGQFKQPGRSCPLCEQTGW